jgi:hypothetical protein
MMVPRAKWVADRFRLEEMAFLLALLALGLAFFVSNAHLELAQDDIGWLNGQAPTVFDRYRHIPRFFFAALHTLFGPNALAALTMIFSFHIANALLVYSLCRTLLGSRVAAGAGASVFFVNPITLGTLTWISCFSYVLGTCLALVSLLAFWRSITEIKGRALMWRSVALASYAAALFCSHEVLLLPLLFLLMSWLHGAGARRQGAALFSVAIALGFLVQHFVYDFGQYGVETVRLFTPGFVSVLVSSVFSFGASLAVAYPLSFIVKPAELLRVSFAEPWRWMLTLLLLTAAILSHRESKAWRMWIFLALSFAVVITPYIIRLYLTPDSVSYHISYVLSGRVFYLPFVVLSLVLGQIVAKFSQRPSAGLVLGLLATGAYGHALLFLYDRTDFSGLQVLKGEGRDVLPSWTPYAPHQPVWLAGLLLVLIVVATLRLYLGGVRGPWRRSGAPTGDEPDLGGHGMPDP